MGPMNSTNARTHYSIVCFVYTELTYTANEKLARFPKSKEPWIHTAVETDS